MTKSRKPVGRKPIKPDYNCHGTRKVRISCPIERTVSHAHIVTI